MDPIHMIEAFAAALPALVVLATVVVSLGAFFAMFTPSEADNKFFDKLFKLVHMMALNMGRARSVPPPRDPPEATTRRSGAADPGISPRSPVPAVLAAAALALLLGLAGCASIVPQLEPFRAAIAERGGQAMDEGLENAEWFLCNAASHGAVERRYGGKGAELRTAYNTVCARSGESVLNKPE